MENLEKVIPIVEQLLKEKVINKNKIVNFEGKKYITKARTFEIDLETKNYIVEIKQPHEISSNGGKINLIRNKLISQIDKRKRYFTNKRVIGFIFDEEENIILWASNDRANKEYEKNTEYFHEKRRYYQSLMSI